MPTELGPALFAVRKPTVLLVMRSLLTGDNKGVAAGRWNPTLATQRMSCFEIPTLEAGLTVALKFLETSLAHAHPNFRIRSSESLGLTAVVFGGGPVVGEVAKCYYGQFSENGPTTSRAIFLPACTESAWFRIVRESVANRSEIGQENSCR